MPVQRGAVPGRQLRLGRALGAPVHRAHRLHPHRHRRRRHGHRLAADRDAAIEKRIKEPAQFNMQKWRALQMLMEEAAKKVFEVAHFGSSSKEFCDHMGRFFDDYKIPLPPSSDDENEDDEE